MKEKAKYYQLFEQLKKDIFQGVYQNGQRLPGENEMAQEFSMSRQTVRQALALLEQEHLIQRRQGSGTYVHRPVPRPKRPIFAKIFQRRNDLAVGILKPVAFSRHNKISELTAIDA